MARRSTWSVVIDALPTRTRLGVGASKRAARPVLVSLRITGIAESEPDNLEQCMDYRPIQRWLVDELPLLPHTELLETRMNQIAQQVFQYDRRVQDVWVGLYRLYSQGRVKGPRIGVERAVTRRQYDEQQRLRRAPAATRQSQ